MKKSLTFADKLKSTNIKTNNKMKKVFSMVMAAALMLAVACNADAQGAKKKVSVLGDSYSTFTGHNPEGYAPFYPNDRNDVVKVEQTWWDLYIKAMGYELEANNSWGGTTICNTGYGRMDSSKSAFNSRVDMLGNPDIIFIFGGTNDLCPTLCNSMDCKFSQSLLKLISIESMMPSNHLIFCCPPLLLSVCLSIRVFSNKLALCIRCEHWSFSLVYSSVKWE